MFCPSLRLRLWIWPIEDVGQPPLCPKLCNSSQFSIVQTLILSTSNWVSSVAAGFSWLYEAFSTRVIDLLIDHTAFESRFVYKFKRLLIACIHSIWFKFNASLLFAWKPSYHRTIRKSAVAAIRLLINSTAFTHWDSRNWKSMIDLKYK